jgi:hypothetical protein
MLVFRTELTSWQLHHLDLCGFILLTIFPWHRYAAVTPSCPASQKRRPLLAGGSWGEMERVYEKDQCLAQTAIQVDSG